MGVVLCLSEKITLTVLVLAVGFAVLHDPKQDPFGHGVRQLFNEYSNLFNRLAGGILLFMGGWCFLLQNRGMGLFLLGLAALFLLKGLPHDVLMPRH